MCFLSQEEKDWILCLSSPVCTVGMWNSGIITWLSEWAHANVISTYLHRLHAQWNHHHPNPFLEGTGPRNGVYYQVCSLEPMAVGRSQNVRSLCVQVEGTFSCPRGAYWGWIFLAGYLSFSELSASPSLAMLNTPDYLTWDCSENCACSVAL